MRFILVILILITLSFIESSLASVPLLLLFILSWSIYGSSRSRYWVAFAAGIFADLLLGRLLGVTAIFFLITALIVSRYQKKIETRNWLYLLFFTAVSVTFYQFIFSHSINLIQLFASSLLIFPIAFVTTFICQRLFIQKLDELSI